MPSVSHELQVGPFILFSAEALADFLPQGSRWESCSAVVGAATQMLGLTAAIMLLTLPNE